MLDPCLGSGHTRTRATAFQFADLLIETHILPHNVLDIKRIYICIAYIIDSPEALAFTVTFVPPFCSIRSAAFGTCCTLALGGVSMDEPQPIIQQILDVNNIDIFVRKLQLLKYRYWRESPRVRFTSATLACHTPNEWRPFIVRPGVCFVQLWNENKIFALLVKHKPKMPPRPVAHLHAPYSLRPLPRSPPT